MIHALTSPEAVLERNCESRNADGFLAQVQAEAGHRVVLMKNGKALVQDNQLVLLPGTGFPEHLLGPALTVYLGQSLPSHHPHLPAGTHLILQILPQDDADPQWVPEGAVFAGYRDAASILPSADAAVFIEAQAVANWHKSHRYCPRCGSLTEIKNAGWMRRCTADGSEHFPRTDPAVIVAIVGGDDRILLANNFAWEENRYSTVAGFVEAGESGEQAAVREIAEEVGVHLDSVDYVGSQAWPFPRSFMLGYMAHTLDTNAVPDNQEVRQARWFARAELQRAVLNGEVIISQRLSIARSLIEHWYGGLIAEPAESGEQFMSGEISSTELSDSSATAVENGERA
ncbi:NAD(+) diphosphatase [Arthrobacter cryoconiti]|uniref:NAD(+) diphosphatase n=1 Tax=Arthrobacter cryoconiti TaxID=748907 RepID=A0ABV8QYN2_9MICC|nr:NAD(+) diphosphatase [Arthrobacter cryoconiti]MCC9068368.1 NAD(+) diphosphatase [Arthrobacter cryoconiti]